MKRSSNWGMLSLIALSAIGCAPTPTERNSGRIWDLNTLTKSQDIVDPPPVKPIRSSERVMHRTGTVAIWAHPSFPARSLIIGADRSRAGGLVVFGLDGKERQRIPVRLPYGIQVVSSFDFGRRRIDIVAVIERDTNRLRVFGVNSGKDRLWEITGDTELVADALGPDKGAMALSLTQVEGTTYAVVTRKSNLDDRGILEFYKLTATEGRVSATRIRQFGAYARRGIVEAVTSDEHTGSVFYYDPEAGIRKYPLFKNPAQELYRFGKSGWAQRCVSLGIFPGKTAGSGIIIGADLLQHETILRLFRRKGAIDQPDSHLEIPLRPTLTTQSATGMAISPVAMPGFPEGMLVLGNGATGQFDYYSWRDIRTQHGSSDAALR